MVSTTVLQGLRAQIVTVLILLLGFTSSCPIPGQGCTLPSYSDLANDYANRELVNNVTAQVHINRDHIVFRPNLIKNYLTNPSHNEQPNGRCEGFQPFNITGASNNVIANTICPWKYECDFDPHRLPATLFYAKCLHSTVNVNQNVYDCTEVFSTMYTIQTSSCDPLSSSTQEWTMKTVKKLPVACIAALAA